MPRITDEAAIIARPREAKYDNPDISALTYFENKHMDKQI